MAKRGRPIKTLVKLDFGTPELIEKRACRLTIEAIDLCLEREIISLAEHGAGLKLRWLYFMKFGSPFISSKELTDCKGRNIPKTIDPEILQEAEQIYTEILNGLDYIKARQIVVDVCIFNIFPFFLNNKEKLINSLQCAKFCSGMKLVYSLLEQYQCLPNRLCN